MPLDRLPLPFPRRRPALLLRLICCLFALVFLTLAARAGIPQLPAPNGSQTITFPAPATPAYAGTAAMLAASSSSGLPITYSIVSGPAKVAGAVITYTGAGAVVVQADQPGFGTISPAAPVQQTVSAVMLTEPVGTVSPGVTTVITFTNPGTLASIQALTQGAPNLDFQLTLLGSVNGATPTCAIGAAYTAGQTCLLGFDFTPALPGTRFGGIALTGTGGLTLATSYLYGTGTGPLVNYLPGVQSTLVSAVTQPAGLAFDAAGNLFIADARAMAVYESTAASGYKNLLPIGSGFTNPVSIAIDGLSNVYVADYGQPGKISEVTAASGYKSTTILVAGLNEPGSVAVDGNGNIFYPDLQTHSIDELSPGGSPHILSNAFGMPAAAGLDGAANLFVLDQSGGSVVEFTAASGYTVQTTLPAKANLSQSIAVNSNGDLFISSNGAGTVEEVLAGSGYNTVRTIASSIVPNGIALDANGNLFVADSATRTVIKYDYADPPTLTFLPTPVGQVSSDSPQTVTLINNGNSNLNLSQILRTNGFTLGAASTCPEPTAFARNPNLPPDVSCTYQVSFAPYAPGPVSGALTISDNNLNVPNATQTIPLNGTGTPITPSIVFTVPNHLSIDPPFTVAANSNSPAPFTYAVVSGPATLSGQTVTVTGPGTVTLQAAQPATGIYAAGSAVTSFNATTPQPQTITFPTPITPAYDATSVTLAATASSGLPVTYMVLGGPATVTGSTLTYTGLGTVTVQATQSGGTSGTAAYTAAPPVTTTVTTQLLTEKLGTRTGQVPTVILFTASGTIANINITTQGATSSEFTFDNRGHLGGSECVAGMVVTAGQTCTLRFDFLPTYPGPRFGGITLTDAQGNLLASSYLLGEGIGPQLFYLPSTQSTIGSGFGYLSGAAVDGRGDLFLSDKTTGISEITLTTGVSRNLNPLPGAADVIVDGSGNVFAIDDTRVVEFPVTNGVIPSNPAPIVLATGFYHLDGIKVDSNGNIFVADGGNGLHPGAISELLAVNGTIPPNPTILPIGSGFGILTGVAVDINGNVFASDQKNHAVFEVLAVNGVIPPNPTITTVGSGFLIPTNVAFDGVGDLFVPDAGTHSIREILAVNGVIPASPTIVDLGSGLVTPQGLVVDPSGNVFIADSSITQVTELNYGIPPTLTFTSTPVNTTSPDSPKAFTIINAGNADLIFLPPVAGNNPTISPGFTIDASSTCPTLGPNHNLSFALPPTQSCTTAVDFLPTAVGPITGTVVRTDNNLDVFGSTQTVKLVGNGLAIAPAIVFAVPDHTFGDPPFPVAATSTSPAPFTYSVLSGPATIAGSLITLTGAGSVTLQATQPATGNYAAGTATATFQVAKKAQTITFAAPATPIPFTAGPITLTASASSGLPVIFSVLSGPGQITSANGSNSATLTITGGGAIVIAADQPGNASYAPAPQVTHTLVVLFGLPTVTLTAAPNPVFLHNPVTLTASVSAPTGTPGGSVTFVDTFGPAGTTPIGTAPVAGGQAILAISSLAVGAHTITAIYSGDRNYASLTSSTAVVLVEDFSVVITNPTLTIQHGGTGVYNLVVTTVGGVGLASTVTLTTAGQPIYSTYVFAPAIIGAGSGTTNGTLTIHTPDFPSGPFYAGRLATGSGITFATLLLLFLPKRRRSRSLLATTLLLVAALASTTLITGCGSGWKTQHWFVTVTATSGNLTRTAQATLISEP